MGGWVRDLHHCPGPIQELEHSTRFYFSTDAGRIEDVAVVEDQDCISPAFEGRARCDQLEVRFAKEDGVEHVDTYSVVNNADDTVVIEYVKEWSKAGEEEPSVWEYVLLRYDSSPIDPAVFAPICDPSFLEDLPGYFDALFA